MPGTGNPIPLRTCGEQDVTGFKHTFDCVSCFFQGLGSAMIVTSGYCVMFVADRVMYPVSWQRMNWMHKLEA